MTQRIGTKGQVVIPKRIRDRLGLGPGAAVGFEEREDGVMIRARAEDPGLRGRYRSSGMAARLLEDRAIEPR